MHFPSVKLHISWTHLGTQSDDVTYRIPSKNGRIIFQFLQHRNFPDFWLNIIKIINNPGKSQHTRRAHPWQSPYPTMKGIPLWPVGKGLGVCSKGVLKQPQKQTNPWKISHVP